MRILTRDEVEHAIYTTLRTAPRHTLAALRAKLPQDADKACAELAAMVAVHLSNASRCVCEADVPPGAHMPGQFGKDEPWPNEMVMVPVMATGKTAKPEQ